jgi:hypothetical protein
MMIMRPPQQGQGCASGFAGSVWLVCLAAGGARSKSLRPASSWCVAAGFFGRSIERPCRKRRLARFKQRTLDQIYSRRGLINRITLMAAEIGDQIVNILERRLAAMRVELQKLEGQGESR